MPASFASRSTHVQGRARAAHASYRVVVIAAAVALLAPLRVARAAGPAPTAEELSTARQLFEQGLAHEDRGAFAEALAVYQRIAKITVSPVLLYRTALCHEKLGHNVEAINAYALATQEAERKGQQDLAAETQSRGRALEQRTPRLVVNAPPDAEGLSIDLDGKVINAALAGAPMLVDPGSRKLVVRAANYAAPFEATVVLGERETKAIDVRLGAKRPVIAQAAAPAPQRAPVPRKGEPKREPESRALPIALTGGAAIVLGGAAIATGLVAHGKHDDYVAQNADPKPGSLEERTALRDEGQALATTSTVLGGAALVAGGVTVYLWLTQPSASTRQVTGLSPWIGEHGGGLVAWGAL